MKNKFYVWATDSPMSFEVSKDGITSVFTGTWKQCEKLALKLKKLNVRLNPSKIEI